MKKVLLMELGLFFIIMCNSVFAAKVDTLYLSEVPVHSQSTEDKQKAAQKGLADVFVKVSGNEQVLKNPRIKQYLRNASTLVQQFGYSASNDKTNPYLLQIHFDAHGVNQCLRDASAAVWGQDRPLILAWIVDETQQPPSILSANETISSSQLLKQVMAKRGVPFALPNMDASDTNSIKANTITTMDITALTAATKRYQSNAILIGQISSNAGIVNTQWKLVMDQNQWGWNITGKSINDIIPALVNNITSTLSAKLAIVTTNTIQKSISLKILGISRQTDFAQLVRYLGRLAPVASVSIVNVNGKDVLLKIGLRSTEESFLQAVSLEHKLTMVQQENNPSPMTLQWNH